MAIPQGAFDPVGTTGTGTGTYTYQADVLFAHYFAGAFFIDTGYDDPVLWSSGVEAAEVYGARVYGTSGTIFPSAAGGAYSGDWRIVATPVWVSKFYVSPSSEPVTQRRIWIRCDCYLTNPISVSAGAYQRLNTVEWTLYRV